VLKFRADTARADESTPTTLQQVAARLLATERTDSHEI
jgi:hypothetical protein